MVNKKTGTPRKKAVKKKSKKSHKPKSHEPLAFRDPRAMEKTMVDIHRLLSEQEFETEEEVNAFMEQFVGVKDLPRASGNLSPLETAQEKVYEAMNASSSKQRVKLAREALEISADCADAYVLLAEETARTPKEARDLFEQGVKAGERALGPEGFKEDAGDFWGILETRPYMRARAGLAEALVILGEPRQAIAHYQELLRLNPGDNQGNRYLLLHLLMKERMDDEVEKVLQQYEDEGMADWLYTRALWLFRREGPSEEARNALLTAFEQNRFVPLFFMGLEKPPSRPPEYIGYGDKNEAVAYFAEAAEEWLETPDALEWLASTMLEEVMKVVEQKQKSGDSE